MSASVLKTIMCTKKIDPLSYLDKMDTWTIEVQFDSPLFFLKIYFQVYCIEVESKLLLNCTSTKFHLFRWFSWNFQECSPPSLHFVAIFSLNKPLMLAIQLVLPSLFFLIRWQRHQISPLFSRAYHIALMLKKQIMVIGKLLQHRFDIMNRCFSKYPFYVSSYCLYFYSM
jgi:hypothetical protein